MAFNGVRISWLTVAKNLFLCLSTICKLVDRFFKAAFFLSIIRMCLAWIESYVTTSISNVRHNKPFIRALSDKSCSVTLGETGIIPII